MPLSANTEIKRYVDQELRRFGVAAAATVFKGSLVGLAGGYARPLVAADPFAGIAYEQADNTHGADGDLSVRVYTQGDFQMTLAGAAVTDVGEAVYASDDATLTKTSEGNSLVGTIVGYVTTDTIIVRLAFAG